MKNCTVTLLRSDRLQEDDKEEYLIVELINAVTLNEITLHEPIKTHRVGDWVNEKTVEHFVGRIGLQVVVKLKDP